MSLQESSVGVFVHRDDEGRCFWNRGSSQDCVWQWTFETAERRVSYAEGSEAFTIVADKNNTERVCARRAAAADLIKTFPQAAARNQNPFGLDHQSWITNRRLPTLDLFSEFHQANLDRIQYEFGEVAAAKYLGNGNDSYYTKRLPVDTLERDYCMVCWKPDRKYELSFAYRWSGKSNMIHGTDCGSRLKRQTVCTQRSNSN